MSESEDEECPELVEEVLGKVGIKRGNEKF